MLLLIDKPKGVTSHDVIYTLRKLIGEKRIGHAGTLDPMASGLLVVGVGRESTKKLGNIAKETQKTYEAEITLGEERDTDDAEGTVINKNESVKPKKQQIVKSLKNMIGESMQTPPSFSAIKLKGKKAYELARSGKEVKINPRKINIYSLDLLDYKYPMLKVHCTVSSGTYIRAIARDLGRSLGAFAYLSDLRRTKIGNFSVENAIALSSLTPQNWKEAAV